MFDEVTPLPSGLATGVVSFARSVGRGRSLLTNPSAVYGALMIVAYFAAARLSVALAFPHSSVMVVCLPAGIGLAAVLLGGYRMVPAVALGALLASLTTQASFVAVLGFTLAGTLEPLAGAALLRRAGFQPALERVRDVVSLVVLAGLVSTIVGATLGVASLLLSGALSSGAAAHTWRMLWLGDMGGDLIVASTVLVLVSSAPRRAHVRDAVVAVLIFVPLATFSVIVFRATGTPVYVVLPMLFLPALLLRQPGAVLGALVVSGIALYYSVRGHGPFAGNLLDVDVLRAQTFVGVAAITALLVAAARSEHQRTETALARLADSEQALAHQARHDALTGLPNRTFFLDRLEHALERAQRSQTKVAVLFLDLDGFKLVNDTLGHNAGDKLLVALTPRLRSALRPGDTVARFGGDEFVVLCEDLNSQADALYVAERIAAACRRPLMIEGREHRVSISVGAVIVEAGAPTPTDVLRDADAAMYRAKAAGKGGVEVFDKAMRARVVERVAVEADLRRALEHDELRLFYQPVVSLASSEVVGVEALIRWQHPQRGLLAPADFMHVAELSGLIVPLGEWVIAQACRQAMEWHDSAPLSAPIKVSVNLSPRQLARSDLAGAVASALGSTGLEPGLLELEITEGMLLEPGQTSRTLQALKAKGVRLVLDDFGTGYSSLSNLKRFTIDALKIDRSFVEGLGRDQEDDAIVDVVLGVAQALDVSVTAAGVETPEQLARLRARGCRFAQGYLFSPPVPADDLEELLTGGRSAAGAPGLGARRGACPAGGLGTTAEPPEHQLAASRAKPALSSSIA